MIAKNVLGHITLSILCFHSVSSAKAHREENLQHLRRKLFLEQHMAAIKIDTKMYTKKVEQNILRDAGADAWGINAVKLIRCKRYNILVNSKNIRTHETSKKIKWLDSQSWGKVERRIGYLTNCKTPKPVMVFHLFIKGRHQLHTYLVVNIRALIKKVIWVSITYSANSETSNECACLGS